MIKTCKQCNVLLNKDQTSFCSRSCQYISQKGKIPEACIIAATKAKLGKKQSKEQIEKRISKRRGSHNSPEHNAKLKERMMGAKNPMFGKIPPNWKGGTKSYRQMMMGRYEYKQWRRTVFQRDDFTCQICGKRGVELHADHIKPWALYPELRYEVTNGRTLCKECHMKTETYGFKTQEMMYCTN